MVAEIFHPGEFIREEIEARGWTQADLASIMGRPIQVVNQILNGYKSVTSRTATELAAAFGTSAEIWLNLQTAYSLSLENVDATAIEKKAHLYKIAPIKIMQKRVWIKKTNDLAELEAELCRFYETKSLDTAPSLRIAARTSAKPTPDVIVAQTAWGYRVRGLAKSLQASKFNKDKVKANLKELLNLAAYPEETRKVPRILAAMGIRFVVVEHLPKTRLDGAALDLDGCPVIGISLRFDRIDHFWHTLLHELSHILNNENMLDADIKEESIGNDALVETRANNDAAGMLIPQEKLNSFIARVSPLYSEGRINQFARIVGVHPGIVVGQLKHKGEIGWNKNCDMQVPIREIVIQEALTDGWGKIISTN
ncbi:MAG: addiction module antidote protein, HigA family [Planctomycetes bacterium RBG_13_46_10]|nr:MAG: addiction module antidote protein, HigA family [Planctomycetes bacterium RBG_13_46_10]